MANKFIDTKQTNNHSGVNDASSTNCEYENSGLLGQITHCKQPDLGVDAESSDFNHTGVVRGLLDV